MSTESTPYAYRLYSQHRYRDAWDHAADRTPHGAPIVLMPGDFG